jgi:hypothetical protein
VGLGGASNPTVPDDGKMTDADRRAPTPTATVLGAALAATTWASPPVTRNPPTR